MIWIMSDPWADLFSGARRRALGDGETLFLTGDRVRHMFRVTQGTVELVRHTQAGTRLVLHRAQAGAVLAEASAYSAAYHCDGVAAGAAQVAALPVARFRAALDTDAALATDWSRRLAQGLQAARMNAEIRSLRRVSDKLDAWLASGRALPPKGAWQGLAAELGVSPEALYRELAARR